MKRTLQAGVLCASICLFSAPVWAAGFQNMSQSATANAMGGVGTANPDEPNSSFYNPANMAFAKGFNIYVGDTIIIPSSSFTDDQGNVTETVAQTFPPPNLHLSMPIAGGFAAGIGLTLPYGLGIEWPSDWEGRNVIVSQSLQTFNLNPNVAFKIPGLDLSIAAGAQIYYSTVELNRNIILRDDTEVATQIGGDGTGFGWNAALMYKPIKPLTIGLNYRSGTTINYTGKAHFSGEEGTPFESSFVDQDVSTSIAIPHYVALGVGYQLKSLFIGVDVGYTTWSDYERIDLEFSRPCQDGSNTCDNGTDKTDPPTTSIVSNWEDSFTFRLGLQYAATKKLKVRAGVVYDMTPIPDETVSPSLPGNNRTAFSLGVGYSMFGVRGDLGYQFVNAAQRDIDNNTTPGLYKTTAHVIGLNLGYGYD